MLLPHSLHIKSSRDTYSAALIFFRFSRLFARRRPFEVLPFIFRNKMSKLTKFFVGNLPWTVSNRELRKYFTSFGHVATADVLFDHTTGLSKGYGFVQFTTAGGYENVLKNPKHELDGQLLVVKTAD